MPPYETAVLSGAPHELRVSRWDIVSSKHSAVTHEDGRYVFYLNAEERPDECVDWRSDGSVVKGHAVSKDGIYDLVLSDCNFCGRAKGKYVRPGKEVEHWLSRMPDACKRYWESKGCTGDGYITIGGDDVRGYCLACPGCIMCKPAEFVLDALPQTD